MKCNWRWLVVVGVYSTLVMACGSTASLEPTALPTADPTLTSSPTPPVVPTLQLSPSSTSTLPTRTPLPTSTARPDVLVGEPHYPGLIVYSQQTRTGVELYTVAPDGTGAAALTDLLGGAFLPIWSPDGQCIAFYFYDPRTDLVDLWVIEIETGEAHALTSGGAAEQTDDLSWSADSRFLIYTTSQPNGAERDIYRLDISTGEEENLTLDCSVWDSAPAWSPNGELIAFVSDRTDAACSGKVSDEIWVMATDGTGLVNLTNNHEYFWEDVDPAWSPDSREIAFYRWSFLGEEYPGGQEGLWVVDVVEHTERLVYSFSPLFSDGSVWSPNGEYIAFNQGAMEETDVWIVPSAGGEATQISDLPGEEVAISWSPDSRAILFTNFHENSGSLYVVPVDSAEIQVLFESGWSSYGNWSP